MTPSKAFNRLRSTRERSPGRESSRMGYWVEAIELDTVSKALP